MGRHRSEKAERRRAEIKLEKAKHEFIELMLGYLESKEGQQLLAALKAFDRVAVSNPAVADRGRVAFVRHHPVLGQILKMILDPQKHDVGSPTVTSHDEIASDTQALEDFRRILTALPSGKGVLAVSKAA